MYATPAELAGYLQQDVDNYTATLALTLASQLFSAEADTMFVSTSVTYSVPGDGRRRLRLPFWPIISVSALRVAGVTIAPSEYTLIRDVLYRKTGTFGNPFRSNWFPPDPVDVDLSHGYTTVFDDVKAAVLETAATAYAQPVGGVVAEQIDDYRVQLAPNASGIRLTEYAKTVAASYRSVYIA